MSESKPIVAASKPRDVNTVVAWFRHLVRQIGISDTALLSCFAGVSSVEAYQVRGSWRCNERFSVIIQTDSTLAISWTIFGLGGVELHGLGGRPLVEALRPEWRRYDEATRPLKHVPWLDG